MKLKIISLLFFLTALLNYSCNTTEPPVNNNTISLTVEDVSCTEAWLKINTEKTSNEIVIKQNDKEVKRFVPISTDTLIVVDSLLPSQTYSFQAFDVFNNEIISASEKIAATTMDTTSHNFTWETFAFGEDVASSALYDVAIIDENNIWAVGAIYIADTSATGYAVFSAVHWNGQTWELKKLVHSNYISVTPRGIFVLGPSEIYLTSGSIFKWDGISSTVQLVYSRLDLQNPNGTIEKLWGSSSSEIYGVGNAGTIIFFNGSHWRRIESGTDLNINDIWGDRIPGTEDYEIICAASNVLQNDGREVIRIKNNLTKKLNNEGLSPYFSGIWFKPARKYYIVGGGIHKKNNVTTAEPWYRYTPGTINNYYSSSIMGTNFNDIFVCGAFGEIVHFNGISWSNFTSATYMPDGVYNSLSINGNLVVLTGYKGPRAIITIGRRN